MLSTVFFPYFSAFLPRKIALHGLSSPMSQGFVSLSIITFSVVWHDDNDGEEEGGRQFLLLVAAVELHPAGKDGDAMMMDHYTTTTTTNANSLILLKYCQSSELV
jgi:hypothetical protein